jgi:DNA-binding SARP family transcriptional activator
LLGGFEVLDHAEVIDLPTDAQRLVAFLALQHRRLPRAYVAGQLWLEANTDRAFGNLRSALWRLRGTTGDLVLVDQQSVSISPEVEIDTETGKAAAHDLRQRSGGCSTMELDLDLFTDELLPGWYDDWTIVERELIRQRSLHALELIATQLAEGGRHMEAIEAALAAIRLEPLRESAHRCLIRIHLGEGNHSEARRHYDSYAQLLGQELGLVPSAQIKALAP